MQDFTDLPAVFAGLFGSEWAAGVFISIILILAGVMAVLIAGKGSKESGTVAVVVGAMTMLGTIAIGWLDSWVILLVVAILGCVFLLYGMVKT